jgi:hypothetical protein
MTDTWTLRWFAHHIDKTFDTDQDAIKSFREYINKNFRTHQDSTGYTYKVTKKGTDEEVCLMGAEDEWRWKVCHCDECKKAKHTIILH